MLDGSTTERKRWPIACVRSALARRASSMLPAASSTWWPSAVGRDEILSGGSRLGVAIRNWRINAGARRYLPLRVHWASGPLWSDTRRQHPTLQMIGEAPRSQHPRTDSMFRELCAADPQRSFGLPASATKTAQSPGARLPKSSGSFAAWESSCLASMDVTLSQQVLRRHRPSGWLQPPGHRGARLAPGSRPRRVRRPRGRCERSHR